MSPIELTSEHKSKLLEMCEALFPEYTIYEVQKANHFGRIVNTVQGNKWEYNGDDDEPIDEFFIHWFEFCMTYLADKIFEDHDNFSNIKDGFITIFSIKDEHPIDYLYEQFKQLK